MFYVKRKAIMCVSRGQAAPVSNFTGITCAEQAKIKWGNAEVDITEVEAMFAKPAISPHAVEEPGAPPICKPFANEKTASARSTPRAHSTPATGHVSKNYEITRQLTSCPPSQASDASYAPPRRGSTSSTPGGQRSGDSDLARGGRAKPGPASPFNSMPPKTATPKPGPEDSDLARGGLAKSGPASPFNSMPPKTATPKPGPEAPHKLAPASSSTPPGTPGPQPKKRTLALLPAMNEIIGNLSGSKCAPAPVPRADALPGGACSKYAVSPPAPRADILTGGTLFHKRRASGVGDVPPIEPRLGQAFLINFRTT